MGNKSNEQSKNWDCECDKAAAHQTSTSLLMSCRVSEGFVGLSLTGVPVLRVTSLSVLVLDAQGGTMAVLGSLSPAVLSSHFQSRPQEPPKGNLV